MRLTTSSSTGHLAMSQIVTAVLPIPSSLPTWVASPPVTTTATAQIASIASNTTVTPTLTGMVIHIGRPSSMS